MFHQFINATRTHLTRHLTRTRMIGVGTLATTATAAWYTNSSRLVHASPTTATTSACPPTSYEPVVPPVNSTGDDAHVSTYPVNMELTRLLPDRPPNLAVRGVLFVTRHGSRTPMSLLPQMSREEFQALWGNCPLGDHTTIPCGRGLLTHFGEFQLGSVGWHLRHRYIHTDHFLPETFDPTLFRFRSTDLPRTQLSLARAVQGLYPGLPLETLAPLVEVRQQKDETMYPNHYFCPRLKEMYIEACHASRQLDPKNYPAAARYKAIADAPDAVALREKIATALRTPADQLGTWVVIGDELKCRQSVGMPQVSGITQQMSDRANELAEQTFWHIMRAGEPHDHSSLKPACTHSSDLLYKDKSPLEQEVVRLGMGRMMHEMFDALDDIKGAHEKQPHNPAHLHQATGTTANPTILTPPSGKEGVPKCLMYSGHDTTIAPLLAAFHATHALMRPNSVGPGWPTLGSNMIIELLESTTPPQQEDPSIIQAKQMVTQRTITESLAPLPPPATDDSEHHLPKQPDYGKEAIKKSDSAPLPSTSSPPATSFQPHGADDKFIVTEPPPKKTRVLTRSPLIHSPQTRWFLRLLVDHKEISIIPYEEYAHVREQYKVKNWIEECKQRTSAPLPPHQW